MPQNKSSALTIIRAFSVMVLAILVQWDSESGETQTAVLKLLDRRFGELFRSRKVSAHNYTMEDCWKRYVECGEAPDLLSASRNWTRKRAPRFCACRPPYATGKCTTVINYQDFFTAVIRTCHCKSNTLMFQGFHV
ncbi:hypothetical protein BJ742DRAFT_144444 [Cladochytrium replicatum]|nr:hypothetical protein BJ742DRAFT_144444 [Cladochytrium replicatum]